MYEGTIEEMIDLLLPDNKDFEEAILVAVLGPSNETERKIEKRLMVFQDITLLVQGPKTCRLRLFPFF